jgi:hypothetical protein
MGAMAQAAWKKAGDDHIAKAEATGDIRHIKEALRCYIKAKDDMMAAYAGLMSGMALKEAEKRLISANARRENYIMMGKDLLSKGYGHAAKFLFGLAGEKDLAKAVEGMENKSIRIVKK